MKNEKKRSCERTTSIFKEGKEDTENKNRVQNMEEEIGYMVSKGSAAEEKVINSVR